MNFQGFLTSSFSHEYSVSQNFTIQFIFSVYRTGFCRKYSRMRGTFGILRGYSKVGKARLLVLCIRQLPNLAISLLPNLEELNLPKLEGLQYETNFSRPRVERMPCLCLLTSLSNVATSSPSKILCQIFRIISENMIT